MRAVLPEEKGYRISLSLEKRRKVVPLIVVKDVDRVSRNEVKELDSKSDDGGRRQKQRTLLTQAGTRCALAGFDSLSQFSSLNDCNAGEEWPPTWENA